MDLKTIVALEIGSSKIKGAVGKVNPDGSLTILAVEEVPSAHNVRYGRIQNIREVARLTGEVVRRLENSRQVQGRKVEGLAIALGGRSLSAVPAEAVLHFPQECEITEQQVLRLKQEAARDFASDTRTIEAVVPRKYYVNKAVVMRAVGSYGETLKGEFMLVTCGKETRQNLDRLNIESVPREEIHYALRPTAIADLVLTRDEKQVGVALIDVGAETTTVITYKGNTMMSLVTIPMGSHLITRDLSMGLGITEEAAENIKLGLTSLDPDDKSDPTPNIQEIKGYARARAGEIIANALNQINLSATPLNSISTIVLTGGGSQLADFAKLVGQQSKINVRMATVPETISFLTPGRNTPENIDIIALLQVATRIPGLKGLRPVRPVEVPEPVVVTPEVKRETVEPQEKAPEKPKPVKPEAPKTPKVETPRPEKPAVVEEEEHYTPPVTRGTGRRVIEDEDLLQDDPDEAEEPQKKKRSSFFDIFRRRNKPVVEEDEEIEEDDDEERVPDITYQDDKEAAEESVREVKSRMDSLSDKLAKMFMPEEENED